MAEETHTHELPVLQERIHDKKGARTPAPFMLPNTKTTFEMLANSGAIFSTATLPGLFQAYIRRAESHYRDQFAHQDEIAAAYQHPLLSELLLELLGMAATMESVRELCAWAHETMDKDPAEVRKELQRASSYAWGAADKADRTTWALGKVAMQLTATKEANHG